MTPTEINRLCERLIAYRDEQRNRSDRDLLADVCNALDGYAKQTRALHAASGKARDVLSEHIDKLRPPTAIAPTGNVDGER